MHVEVLLQQLNHTPLKINTKLMYLKLEEHDQDIKSAKEYIYHEMTSAGMKINENYISERAVVDYCNQYLIKKYSHNRPYYFDASEKFNVTDFQEHFPKEPLVNAYVMYRESYSLKKRYEAILKYEKNGYIQPIFSVNSAGSIYSSKPALQLPYADLALYLDCNFHHFETFEKALKAVSKAKEDSEIITVLRTTVFYRNFRYKQEKEKRRQEVITAIEAESPFMLLEPYYGEFTLEELGYSYQCSSL